MAYRGPALMGSGFGEGENRAQEAAQEAVSSPLLDNVTISGAKGVLLNISGGTDLAIDEVTQISTIIQEEVGDEAEIIFGAVHDPSLNGKVRVTVIATGFDDPDDDRKVIRPDFQRPMPKRQAVREAAGGATGDAGRARTEAHTRPEVERKVVVAAGGFAGGFAPSNRFSDRIVTQGTIGELDIPTFIRRQMD